MKITFIGHATALIQTKGINILTDPVFSDRPWPLGLFKRPRKAGMTIGALPHIDVILLSHMHTDHWDPPTLRKLNKDAKVFVPIRYKWMASWLGFGDVRALDGIRQESFTVRKGKKSVRLTAIRSRHPMNCTGYVIEGDKTVYVPGDTGYFDASFLKKFRIDLVLLPLMRRIPVARLFNQHINAPEAMRMTREMKAKRAMPVHWGFFPRSDVEKDSFIASMKASPMKKRLLLLDNGRSATV